MKLKFACGRAAAGRAFEYSQLSNDITDFTANFIERVHGIEIHEFYVIIVKSSKHGKAQTIALKIEELCKSVCRVDPYCDPNGDTISL